MVTEGNWPWWLIDSAWPRLSKWAMALSGTGVEAAVVPVVPPPPLPPVPAVDAPVLEPARVVPLVEVEVLEEMLVEVLWLERTLELEADVEADESEEVALTPEVAEMLGLLFEKADVPVAAAEMPEVTEGVSIALPGDAATPEPAPEDDPAVAVAVEEEVALVSDD